MENPKKFRTFIKGIAEYDEWEYEDGTAMNDDASAFMQYVEHLEKILQPADAYKLEKECLTLRCDKCGNQVCWYRKYSL